MDFVPVPGHSSPQALKQKEARCAAGRWCCQARVLAVSQPTCRAGLLLFLWLLDALQFGAWAPGSLGPWALPVTHRASDLLSVGTPVVPQALALVCMQRGDCEDRNLFAPGEEN